MRALAFIGVFTLAACGAEENDFVRTPGRSSNDQSETAPKEEAVLTPTGASCSNGVKDGDETDVDCGGATCPVCANGDACATGNDCGTGHRAELPCARSMRSPRTAVAVGSDPAPFPNRLRSPEAAQRR